MKTQSFFKVIRGKRAIEISNKPNVLAILFKLGLFTPRSGDEESKFIRIKWSEMAMTKDEFEWARDYLVNTQLTLCRTSNKGTWFKLISSSLIDINEDTTLHTTLREPLNSYIP
jgi:hypothetical protein